MLFVKKFTAAECKSGGQIVSAECALECQIGCNFERMYLAVILTEIGKAFTDKNELIKRSAMRFVNKYC